MDTIVTHQTISDNLCGKPLVVQRGFSRVELTTSDEMAVDSKGLIHGGFIFGLADYAAMIAVNDPNVVLGSAQSIFKKPVKSGETIIAEATLKQTDKNKRIVDVSVSRDGVDVFTGSFTCFVLKTHVLDQ